jgi:hypothetical protein
MEAETPRFRNRLKGALRRLGRGVALYAKRGSQQSAWLLWSTPRYRDERPVAANRIGVPAARGLPSTAVGEHGVAFT